MGSATQPPGSQAVASRETGMRGLGLAAARSRGDLLERNAFLIVVLGLGVALQSWLIRGEIGPDSWYTLLSGRTIVGSGFPGRDTLTVLTAGREWVDQQWLGQLTLYGLWRLGGWPLALLSLIAIYVATFVVLASAARRLGASDRSIALVAFLCFATGLSHTAFRAQIPAYLLFALVLWLLIADEQHPSRRVLLVFPLLVVWANVHGSVILGAGLVVLRGVVVVVFERGQGRGGRDWLPRAGALLLLPFACVLASPYALDLPGYYRRVLDNRTLANTVTEWAPTTIHNQPLFFWLLVVGIGVCLGGRRALSPFTALALLATGVAGSLAVRNVVWFAFVCAAILPRAVDVLWRPVASAARRPVNLALAAFGIAVAVGCAGAAAAHRRAWFEHSYPRAAIRAVSGATTADAAVRVYADAGYGDWLLFEDPRLAGRVAYDIRYELLTPAQLTEIAAFPTQRGPNWMRAIAGYGVLVLDPVADRGAITFLERDRGTTVLYRDAVVAVLRRSAESGS